MNTYSGKNADAKTSNYVTTKAMKKIEKKSIKFAMKNQIYHSTKKQIL